MSNEDFLDQMVNAFGSPHFSADEVIEALHQVIQERQEQGLPTGSLIALINALPDLEKECKKRY